jgi:cbb3-type cytochrome oxidase maturation protein
MDILLFLIPISLFLGSIGLGAFLFTLRTRQYDDPAVNVDRILSGTWDQNPKPNPATSSSI